MHTYIPHRLLWKYPEHTHTHIHTYIHTYTPRRLLWKYPEHHKDVEAQMEARLQITTSASELKKA